LIGKFEVTPQGILDNSRAWTDPAVVQVDVSPIESKGLLNFKPKVFIDGCLFSGFVFYQAPGREHLFQAVFVKSGHHRRASADQSSHEISSCCHAQFLHNKKGNRRKPIG
jgi:hypothetical protein